MSKGKEVTYKGDTDTLPKLVAKYGNVGYLTVTARLRKGMSLDAALRTYPDARGRRARRFKVRGKTGTMIELCKTFDILPGTVERRLKMGWTAERAFTTPTQARPD